MWRSASTPDLHRGLAGLARETGASLFMVLQAGLAGLLSRLGAGTDIAIGSPIAGRTDAALDDLIGFFVNTLVLRTDTSGQPGFRELIGRVRGRNLAAYGHQELPFERLVEVLNPARSLSRHPLFQVMLAFEAGEAGAGTLELPGLAVTPQPIATASAKFDLSVGLVERRLPDGTPGGIDGVLEYASDLFDAATVETSGPPSHPAAGGRGGGRRTAARQPADPGDRRARHHPARLERHDAAGSGRDPAGAVCRAGGAHAGRGRGGVRGPHAHATPRSTPTPTGWRIICRVSASGPRRWWGCAWSARPRWWSGCSASSRPAAPTCRSIRTIRASGSAFMLADAGCPVLVTQSALLDRLPTPLPSTAGGATIVRLDADWPAIARQPDTAPPLDLDPRHPAYVIYTSGSTGTPKGVVVEHASLANKMLALGKNFEVGSDFRSALFISSSFDASIEQTLLPFIGGGAAVVISDDVRESPSQFWQQLSTRSCHLHELRAVLSGKHSAAGA